MLDLIESNRSIPNNCCLDNYLKRESIFYEQYS